MLAGTREDQQGRHLARAAPDRGALCADAMADCPDPPSARIHLKNSKPGSKSGKADKRHTGTCHRPMPDLASWRVSKPLAAARWPKPKPKRERIPC